MPLDNSFELNGRTYTVDHSFDLMLDVFEMFDNEVMNDIEKMRTAILMLTDEAVDNLEDIVAVWSYIDEHFLKTKKERVVYDRNGNPMPVAKNEEDDIRLIDFEVDAMDIYASFMQAYQYQPPWSTRGAYMDWIRSPAERPTYGHLNIENCPDSLLEAIKEWL